jgi:hypothetical protein
VGRHRRHAEVGGLATNTASKLRLRSRERSVIKCSHASRNNKLGESCSVAWASKDSSSSLSESSSARRARRRERTPTTATCAAAP